MKSRAMPSRRSPRSRTRRAGIWFSAFSSRREQFEIVGVLALDKVQNDLLSALRSREKISYQMATSDDVIETETGKLLVFYIPEAPRQHKPVYLNGDIRRSYIRRGAGDQRCNEDDIRRFLRAAGGPSYEVRGCRSRS